MIKKKSLFFLGLFLSFVIFTMTVSAIDIAIIGIKPSNAEQWLDAEKISGSLYKALGGLQDVKVLSSGQVAGLIGDRKSYLDRYSGETPQIAGIDAVVIGEIVPQGDSFRTAVRLYNLKSNEQIEYSLAGKPGNLDKNLANGLAQTFNANLSSEHKVVGITAQTVDLMTSGIGAFLGQKLNVYRAERVGHEAFAKYMKSPVVRVGQVEVINVTGKMATARILRQDPYLKIKTGDSVSRLGVVNFGVLDLDSNPRGASVFLDGYLIGRTPVTIYNVPEGTYHLRFSEMQHLDHTEITKVKGDSVERVYVTLPERPGQLNISSNKQGELFINNVKKGNTPLVVSLPKGLYRLELVVPGYPSQEQTIWVTPGMISPVTFHITGPLSESYFDSTPAGSSVYLDGNYIGATPLGPYYVEPGYHDLKITKAGWRDWTQKYLFNSGKKERIEAELLLPPGTITVYTEPIKATVKVDGKEVGTTPLIYKEAGPGTIKVEIIKDGYRTITDTLTIYSNEMLVIEKTLERKVGSLVIKSKTGVSPKVYIDGIYSGKAPLEFEKLNAGTYNVELFSGILAARDLVTVKDREIKEYAPILVPYSSLPNVEKHLLFKIGNEFGGLPLTIGIKGSLPLLKSLTLKAGFNSYTGSFGGGYGEYARYTSSQASFEYYPGSAGIFAIARYRVPAVGDSQLSFGGGFVVRTLKPDNYCLNAKLGVLYESKPDLFWEFEANTKIGIPSLLLGAKIGSSPSGRAEGALQIGITF